MLTQDRAGGSGFYPQITAAPGQAVDAASSSHSPHLGFQCFHTCPASQAREQAADMRMSCRCRRRVSTHQRPVDPALAAASPSPMQGPGAEQLCLPRQMPVAQAGCL